VTLRLLRQIAARRGANIVALLIVSVVTFAPRSDHTHELIAAIPKLHAA
jgi:hypothetical protein